MCRVVSSAFTRGCAQGLGVFTCMRLRRAGSHWDRGVGARPAAWAGLGVCHPWPVVWGRHTCLCRPCCWWPISLSRSHDRDSPSARAGRLVGSCPLEAVKASGRQSGFRGFSLTVSLGFRCGSWVGGWRTPSPRHTLVCRGRPQWFCEGSSGGWPLLGARLALLALQSTWRACMRGSV